MENDPFIDDFPIKSSIYSGFPMAMLNNQRVHESIMSRIMSTLVDENCDGVPQTIAFGNWNATPPNEQPRVYWSGVDITFNTYEKGV